MKQSTRFGAVVLALFAIITGLVLAVTSLAHNIEGVLPRISAVPGTFQFYTQMIMEGGATVGLNMVALFGFTYASAMALRGNYFRSTGLTLVAILAMLWSGTTQLGVIAEKTFSVAGGKQTSQNIYENATAEYAQLKQRMPPFHKFMDDAQNDLQVAIAALKSQRYGRKTAWQTTNQCNADITAAKSIALCDNYRMALKHLATSKLANKVQARMNALAEIIKKGPPATIDAGPEIVADVSAGALTVKTVQIILVFLRSFGIDLSAGLFLAAGFSLWPKGRSSGVASDAHQHPPHATGAVKPVQTRQHTQRIIEHIKSSVQTDEHVNTCNEQAVFAALSSIAVDGEFVTNYRTLSDQSGVATGAMNDVLAALVAKNLIERYSSKGRGTVGKILEREYA